MPMRVHQGHASTSSELALPMAGANPHPSVEEDGDPVSTPPDMGGERDCLAPAKQRPRGGHSKHRRQEAVGPSHPSMWSVGLRGRVATSV